MVFGQDFENNVAPPAQAERFENWVERACFQWRSPDGKVVAPVAHCTHRASEAAPLSSLRVSVEKPLSSPRVSAANLTHLRERQEPQLQFSTGPLFSDKALRQQYRSLADVAVLFGRVINTLLRLVHGGGHGIGFRSGFRISTAAPSETNDNERTQKWGQSDIADEITSHDVKTRKNREYSDPMRIHGKGRTMQRLSGNIGHHDDAGFPRKSVSHVLVMSD